MNQNPMFSNIETGEAVYDNVDRATYKGITVKTSILLLITVLIAAVVAFALPDILTNNYEAFYTLLAISSIVGFISVIVGRMSERKAKYASVIYAICEGLFLGSLSAILEAVIPGIVTTAVFSTIALFAIMLILFATGVMRVGSKMRSICFGLTLGAIVIIPLMFILNIVIGNYTTYLGIMIGVEVFLLFYGVITLSMNFQEANAVVSMGASKDAEWSVSLGLLVSIVYIYVEVLRLIALVVARNDR